MRKLFYFSTATRTHTCIKKTTYSTQGTQLNVKDKVVRDDHMTRAGVLIEIWNHGRSGAQTYWFHSGWPSQWGHVPTHLTFLQSITHSSRPQCLGQLWAGWECVRARVCVREWVCVTAKQKSEREWVCKSNTGNANVLFLRFVYVRDHLLTFILSHVSFWLRMQIWSFCPSAFLSDKECVQLNKHQYVLEWPLFSSPAPTC